MRQQCRCASCVLMAAGTCSCRLHPFRYHACPIDLSCRCLPDMPPRRRCASCVLTATVYSSELCVLLACFAALSCRCFPAMRLRCRCASCMLMAAGTCSCRLHPFRYHACRTHPSCRCSRVTQQQCRCASCVLMAAATWRCHWTLSPTSRGTCGTFSSQA
jgi:hypothetical protein